MYKTATRPTGRLAEYIYRYNVYQLVRAGSASARRFPTVAGLPPTIAKLTAPLVRGVHPAYGGGGRTCPPCHPRRTRACSHARLTACFERHTNDRACPGCTVRTLLRLPPRATPRSAPSSPAGTTTPAPSPGSRPPNNACKSQPSHQRTALGIADAEGRTASRLPTGDLCRPCSNLRQCHVLPWAWWYVDSSRRREPTMAFICPRRPTRVSSILREQRLPSHLHLRSTRTGTRCPWS